MKKIIKISSVAALLLPSFAFAAKLTDVFTTIGNLVKQVAPILMGFAFAYFLYGVIKYIMAGSDDISKAAGKQVMIGGIIGLFVMISVWGIVGMLASTFDVTDTTIDVPSTPGEA